MKKKMLKYSILIIVCLIALILLESKVKAATKYNDEISYYEDSSEIEVVPTDKYIKSATIPSQINGKPVTRIAEFNDCKYLRTVKIPSTVKIIDDSCFANCEKLESINIPSLVTSIGYQAFYDCKALTKITLPGSLKSNIGIYAFAGCSSLKTVTIETGITVIPESCFHSCTNLTAINIPSTVISIEPLAFCYCESITAITIPSTVQKLGEGFQSRGDVFSNCTSLRTVTINAKLKYIEEHMFLNCTSLTTVNLPTTLVTMGDGVFESCTSLESIVLPDGLEDISNATFNSCKKLTNVYIPDTVTKIGNEAFRECTSLTSIKIPYKVKEIGEFSFILCENLRNVYFGNSIQNINSFAFSALDFSNPEMTTFYGYSGTPVKSYAEGKGFKYVECKPTTSIKVTGTKSTILKNSKISLNATVLPTASYNKDLKWTSSDTSIATVTQSGVVTPKKTGTVTIVATARDGTGIKGTYTIKIIATELPFNDVTIDDWFYSVVEYTYKNEIIKGYSATKFAPNVNLTRGQLATMLWRMEGSPKATGGKKFSDVKTSNEFYTPIKWASSKGVVNGYANGKFGVNDNITREDLAVMLNNYAKYKGNKVTSNYNINKYKDISKVSSYAKSAVQWAVEKGIISGKESGTKLDPKGKATRAEVAAMLYSYKTKIK